jgi:hypothetical protein
MKRKEGKAKKDLLKGMPYTKEGLRDLKIAELKMLASVMGIDSWQKPKAELVKLIFKEQHELDSLDERLENLCEMCGKYVAIRQRAHIVSEGDKNRENILMLCPTCHLMFDTRLKPKLYKALSKAGVRNLPG